MFNRCKTITAVVAALAVLGLMAGNLRAGKPRESSPKYHLTVLDGLVPGLSSGAAKVADTGDVVGWSYVDPNNPDVKRAVIWWAGTTTPVDLNIFLPDAWKNAGWVITDSNISNSGDKILGSMAHFIPDINNPGTNKIDANSTCRYTVSTGVFEELGDIGANFINDAGDVAGTYYQIPIKIDGTWYSGNQGFLLTAEGQRWDLLLVGGWQSSGLSNRAADGSVYLSGGFGRQVPRCTVNATTGARTFIWIGPTKVSGRGDEFTQAAGINDRGQVTGRSTAGNARGSELHPFRYTDGTGMLDLGTLGGNQGMGFGINAGGDVVGTSGTSQSTGPSHAFLYTDGTKMVDLRTAIIESFPAGFSGVGPTSINRTRAACGRLWSDSGDGSYKAMLLTPATAP